jgi:hypothetical protein
MAYDFGGEVARFGGQFKPFSHKAFMDQKPDLMTRGHCFGLTIVWLSRYVRDQSKGAVEALGNLNFTAASKDPQTIMVIRQIQNMVNSRGMTAQMNKGGIMPGAKAAAAQKSREIEAVFGQSDDTLINEIMKSLGIANVTFYGDGLAGTDLATSLIGLMQRLGSGLFAIHMGRHEVGAIADTKRGVCKFLDVNFGQAVWKGPGDASARADGFYGFLEAYFAAPAIRASYDDKTLKGVAGWANAMLPGDA